MPTVEELETIMEKEEVTADTRPVRITLEYPGREPEVFESVAFLIARFEDIIDDDGDEATRLFTKARITPHKAVMLAQSLNKRHNPALRIFDSILSGIGLVACDDEEEDNETES